MNETETQVKEFGVKLNTLPRRAPQWDIHVKGFVIASCWDEDSAQKVAAVLNECASHAKATGAASLNEANAITQEQAEEDARWDSMTPTEYATLRMEQAAAHRRVRHELAYALKVNAALYEALKAIAQESPEVSGVEAWADQDDGIAWLIKAQAAIAQAEGAACHQCGQPAALYGLCAGCLAGVPS